VASGGSSSVTGSLISRIDISALSGVQGAWDMEGDLADRGPNNLPLALSSGPTLRYVTVLNKQWLYRHETTLVQRASFDTELAITGAFTGHQLAIFSPNAAKPSAGVYMFAFNKGGSSSTNNILYSLKTDSSTTVLIETIHERGAGSNEGPIDFGVEPLPEPCLYTLTRAANGLDYILYINGIAVASGSVANAPDFTGTTARFALGLQDDVNQSLISYVGDTVIQNVTMSAADVLAVAQQVGVAFA
jgi:hypothetical protein